MFVLLPLALEIAPPSLPTAAIPQATSSGATVIAYDVNISGQVTHCSVFQSSGVPELDRKACEIFQARARFDPKRDSRGGAVAMINRKTRIVWNVER